MHIHILPFTAGCARSLLLNGLTCQCINVALTCLVKAMLADEVWKFPCNRLQMSACFIQSRSLQCFLIHLYTVDSIPHIRGRNGCTTLRHGLREALMLLGWSTHALHANAEAGDESTYSLAFFKAIVAHKVLENILWYIILSKVIVDHITLY